MIGILGCYFSYKEYYLTKLQYSIFLKQNANYITFDKKKKTKSLSLIWALIVLVIIYHVIHEHKHPI